MKLNYFSSQDNQLLWNLEWHVALIIYVCAFPIVGTKINIQVEIDIIQTITFSCFCLYNIPRMYAQVFFIFIFLNIIIIIFV